MGIARIVSNTIKQIKMEEQGNRSILIMKETLIALLEDKVVCEV